MLSENDLRQTIDEYLLQLERGAPGAKGKIKALISKEAGVSKDAIAVSIARGGTKQTRNRLGQAEVQKGTELTIFLLDESDPMDASVHYVIDSIRGRNDARPPVGPLLFATPRPNQSTLLAMVEGRPTKASRVVRDIYDVTPVDPRDALAPQLPSGVSLWLLMSSGQSLNGDIDGVRYHFSTSIPNGQRVRAGDVIVAARTKGSSEQGGDCVIGVGRVGRRVDVDEDRHALAYFDRYLRMDPAVPLDELKDPRKNVDSIVPLDAEWVAQLMKLASVELVEDLPVPITALSLDSLIAGVRSDGLIFEDSLIGSVLAAIRSGKHIMLTGAPGTGKTSLALSIAAAAKDAGLCNEVLLTTGTADWTSADTVGSYRLTKDQQLRFHPGHVVLALEQDRWLIIDELNRADIDKAIGQLFTALSGQAVTLPFEEHDEDVGSDVPISIVPPGQQPPVGTIPKRIQENWRLIVTLNDRDRDLLFDMSEALLRRFAAIEVPAPAVAAWRQIMRSVGGTGRSEWDNALERLIGSDELSARPLGAAVLLDCVYHLREIAHLHEELGTPVDPAADLQKTLSMYVAPQLRTLSASVKLDATSLMQKTTDGNTSSIPGGS